MYIRSSRWVMGWPVCLTLVAAGPHSMCSVWKRGLRTTGCSSRSSCSQECHHQAGREQGACVCVFFSVSVELVQCVCNSLSLSAVSGGVGVCFSGVGAVGGVYKAAGGCSCSADASLSAVSSGLYRGRCYTLLSQNTIREWQRCIKHTCTFQSLGSVRFLSN